MSDAIIGALATARMDALKEAAKLAWSMDAKYMRSKYKIEHNRKRYDVYGVERCENKAANVISEDIHNAILALIPAPPTDAEVLAAAMELPQIKALKLIRDELDNLLDAITADDKFGDRSLTITGPTSNLKWLIEAQDDARSAIAAYADLVRP